MNNNLTEAESCNDILPEQNSRVAEKCVCCGSSDLKSSPAILMPFVADRTFGWEPVKVTDDWGLKTIKNGHAYSICKSLYCVRCGLLFLDIRFSESELGKLYEDYRGEDYNSLREKYEPGYTVRNANLNAGIPYIAQIEQFLRPYLTDPITVLDWGGDTGKNTPFKDEAVMLDVYDISNKQVLSGFNIVGKAEAYSKSYSLVVCSNVLEHVPYPAEILLDIKKAIRPETVVYLEIPFEDVVRLNSRDLHLKKKHWHEHINFFSEESLKILVNKVGLAVISSKILQGTAGGNSANLFQLACKLK